MKNIILSFLTIFVFSCCSKDDQPVAEIDKLPPATTIGANKGGCLVNGIAFLPKGSNQFGPTLSCFYQLEQGTYHFGLAITEKGKNENKTVNISLNPSLLVENTTYNLGQIINGQFNYASNFGEYRISSNVVSALRFITTSTNVGEFKITKLDTRQRIISGTFWYDAYWINENVQVREGRFDMRYVN